jgi:hypothetical protein
MAPAPVDRVLELLRAAGLPYKWHDTQLSRWDSTCPACLTGTWNLTIIDRGSAVDLRCRDRCSEEQILSALRERPAVVLAQARQEAALELAAELSRIAREALALAEGVVA